MLFFKLTNTFYLLFLFFYFSLVFLNKFIHSLCCKTKTISQSVDDGLEHKKEEEEDLEFFSAKCSEKEDSGSPINGSQDDLYEEDLEFINIECLEKGYLVADIICGGEALLFLPSSSPKDQTLRHEQGIDPEEHSFQEPSKNVVKEDQSLRDEQGIGPEEHSFEEPYKNVVKENQQVDQIEISFTASVPEDSNEHDSIANKETYEEEHNNKENLKVEKNFVEDENFFIIVSPKLERNLKSQQPHDQETLGDSFTVGSTSKSSSEWRTSIHYKELGSEDRFSSSSRRSCPTWESYTIFQKYDEEMMFYDRVSAQKLNETKLLRPVDVLPRSFSKRIKDKLTIKHKRWSEYRSNPYHELEAAYVAQICLTWEALNLNYKNFKRFRALQLGEDPGFPAHTAQQYQQFQVLLQRFLENEPYEHGRRPEVYARSRTSSPKLLQVPELKDSENDQKEESLNSKISSVKFLAIMEDSIRTFMNFLKADREKHHQILTGFIKRRHRTKSVDPTLLHMLKKANKRKKKKLKDMGRARKCVRKARMKEDEMEIVMGLIDLKVVSRVLKMFDISEEQLQWCEEKMSRIRFWEGKLQRDSTPLFFPPH